MAATAAEESKDHKGRTIVQSTWTGHTDAVQCIGVPLVGHGIGRHIVATGSDDRSVRLWDARVGKSIKRISDVFDGEAGGPVTAVAFQPPYGDSETWGFAAAAGTTVCYFDLRNTAVLMKSAEISGVVCDEDINSLQWSPNCEFLAASTDSGEIALLQITEELEWDVQEVPVHDGAIVGGSVFLSNELLLSGGYDCMLAVWDVEGNVHHTIATMAASESTASHTTPSGQMFNPPFVHSLDMAEDGSSILVALGDGGVLLLNKSLEIASRFAAHKSAVVSAVYSKATTGSGRSCLTAANDRYISAWHLVDSDGKAEEAAHAVQFKHLGTLQHESAINAICSVPSDSDIRVAVADTTNSVTVYAGWR